MRTAESFPVFRNQGTTYDPPEAGTPSKAKRVFRTHYCRHTGLTKRVTRTVFVTHGRDADGRPTSVVRTTLESRTPPRPAIIHGYVTREERRADSVERTAAWQKLSPAEQMAALDRRLGVGVGAVKQRAALMRRMAANPNITITPTHGSSQVNQPHTTEEKWARKLARIQAAAPKK